MQVMGLTWGSVLAWIASVYGATPDGVRTAAYVALLFMLLDSCSGVVVAARQGALRSQRMRSSLLAKATQYTLLLGLSGGVGLVIRSWFAVQWALGGIAMIEVVSILEHIHKLEALGGVSFGPARPIVMWLGRLFEQSDQQVGIPEKREDPHERR